MAFLQGNDGNLRGTRPDDQLLGLELTTSLIGLGAGDHTTVMRC
jgi:hypothetical protein